MSSAPSSFCCWKAADGNLNNEAEGWISRPHEQHAAPTLLDDEIARERSQDLWRRISQAQQPNELIWGRWEESTAFVNLSAINEEENSERRPSGALALVERRKSGRPPAGV
jgi:hypothetical protein